MSLKCERKSKICEEEGEESPEEEEEKGGAEEQEIYQKEQNPTKGTQGEEADRLLVDLTPGRKKWSLLFNR